MLAAFGVEVLKFLRLSNIVKVVKGFKRTLLVQIKTRKLESFKSKRGQQLPQSLYKSLSEMQVRQVSRKFHCRASNL